MEHVTLKNLRKNSKNAHYVYFNENETFYFETEHEAIKAAMTLKKGDICKIKSSKCLAYYCDFSKGMRFGFGASDLDKTILRSIWWANWDEVPIEESWKRSLQS